MDNKHLFGKEINNLTWIKRQLTRPALTLPNEQNMNIYLHFSEISLIFKNPILGARIHICINYKVLITWQISEN